MPSFLNRYGPWALICGSADGLGAAYSRALAKRGLHLIMVDFQPEKLETLRQELEQTFDIQTVGLALDLSSEQAHEKVFETVSDRDCHLMVYNAAYGPVKMFNDNEKKELDTYLNVNSRVPLYLAHHFVQQWTSANEKGGMIFMGSLAGLRGTQMVAPYSATKAFSSNLAEALHFELKDFGIDVLGVCPGTMRTNPYMGSKPKTMPMQPPIQEPDDVAEEVLRALGKKVLHIPGRYNRLTDRFLGWLPRNTATRIMNDSMRKIYPHFWKGPKVNSPSR